MAMWQIQEQSCGLTAEASEGHSVGHSASRAAWDLHSSAAAPASPSHHTVILSSLTPYFVIKREELFGSKGLEQTNLQLILYIEDF